VNRSSGCGGFRPCRHARSGTPRRLVPICASAVAPGRGRPPISPGGCRSVACGPAGPCPRSGGRRRRSRRGPRSPQSGPARVRMSASLLSGRCPVCTVIRTAAGRSAGSPPSRSTRASRSVRLVAGLGDEVGLPGSAGQLFCRGGAGRRGGCCGGSGPRRAYRPRDGRCSPVRPTGFISETAPVRTTAGPSGAHGAG
jgi:hypothetical protein